MNSLTNINTPLDEVSAALVGALDIQHLYDHPDKAGDGILVRSDRLDDLCRVTFLGTCIRVAFAGTRNNAQWLSNADDLAQPMRLPGGLRVHPGAVVGFRGLETRIHDALQTMGAYRHELGGLPIPVDVVGHSRGGFLAIEFVRRFGPRVFVRDVITLGSPRVGSGRYCEFVMRHVHGRVLRWTNNNDPVVELPTPIRGYRHIGERLHLDSRGRVHSGGLGFARGLLDGFRGRVIAAFRKRLTDGVDDHRLPTGYIPALRAAYEHVLNTPSRRYGVASR